MLAIHSGGLEVVSTTQHRKISCFEAWLKGKTVEINGPKSHREKKKRKKKKEEEEEEECRSSEYKI
jgi:hypothetical protein